MEGWGKSVECPGCFPCQDFASYMSPRHRRLLSEKVWKKSNRETSGFFDVVCSHSCAYIKNAQASLKRDSPRLRMTLQYFVRMSETMMRSYFMKGKKQKFGSTLSTVIDVCIICIIISIEFIKLQLYFYFYKL